MSRFVSVVVSSFLVVAAQAAIGGSAVAQDQPSVEPAPGEAAPGEAAPAGAAPAEPARPVPPPVAQESAVRPAVFDAPGVDFGARVGYGLPFGNTSGTDKLSDGTSGVIPLVLEVGYRVNANFTIGGLFQYGFMQVKENSSTGCGGGLDCSGSIVRLGIEAIYNLNLDATMSPWVGIGTGSEWFSITESASGPSASGNARGFEFVTLHAGGDFRLASQFALGPFVSLSIAEYTNASAEIPGFPTMTMDLTDKKLHEWLQFGVRGRFGI